MIGRGKIRVYATLILGVHTLYLAKNVINYLFVCVCVCVCVRDVKFYMNR